jgi:hypothetical protein
MNFIGKNRKVYVVPEDMSNKDCLHLYSNIYYKTLESKGSIFRNQYGSSISYYSEIEISNEMYEAFVYLMYKLGNVEKEEPMSIKTLLFVIVWSNKIGINYEDKLVKSILSKINSKLDNKIIEKIFDNKKDEIEVIKYIDKL